jgi:16S rRNA (adenine1518-N6/adenine1519-N6)-dimethyltransferase
MSTQIDLLKKYGIAVRGHIGQHLLIDPNLQRKTVECLELQSSDKVLEIGPGLGALTTHLLGRCERFVAVEKDPQFVEVLKKEHPEFSDKKNALIHSDILEFDFKELGSPGKSKWKVISNLPYYITAPILFHLLDHRALFSKMVFTMQKEVGDRLLASPGSKDYGRLTLALRYTATVRHAFDVPPSCFTPQPAVGSSVVVLDMIPESSLSAAEEERLFGLIKTAFSQRRKMFLSLLASDRKIGKSREELQKAFEECRIPLKARGEELLLKDYLQLLERLKPVQTMKKR